MVFKRRTKLPFAQRVLATIYPRGGYLRAIWYVLHRLRRLPDKPHRIARGIAAGVLVSFTPFFGFHFVIAVALAWLIRGNFLAAILATFFGNPVTFPIIMALSVELGNRLLGNPGGVPVHEIVSAFGHASAELWLNFWAILSRHATHWQNLKTFFDRVFWPYFIGGLIPGLISALACYYLSLPLIAAYQKRRKKKLTERVEKLRAHRAHAAHAAPTPPGADPTPPGRDTQSR